MQLCMSLYAACYVRNPQEMCHYGCIQAIKDSFFNLLFDKQSVKYIYRFKDKYHLISTLANTESYHCAQLFCRKVNCRKKCIFPQTYRLQIRIKNCLTPKPQSSLQEPLELDRLRFQTLYLGCVWSDFFFLVSLLFIPTIKQLKLQKPDFLHSI